MESQVIPLVILLFFDFQLFSRFVDFQFCCQIIDLSFKFVTFTKNFFQFSCGVSGTMWIILFILQQQQQKNLFLIEEREKKFKFYLTLG